MTKLTPAQKKALEMGKSVCVTAGAGTGKTFILTQRYMRLLEYGILPRDIVALTYTEKAAAEMQTKIGRELKRQADERPEMRESWETFSQATISTFHGFCLAILKEFAYEADLDPGFSVMDELDKAELVERTITSVLENPPEEIFDAVVRLHTYYQGGDLKSAVRTFASAPAEWFARLETDPESVRLEWLDRYCRYMQEKGVDTRAEFFSLLETETEEVYLPYLADWFFTDEVNRGIISRLMENPDQEGGWRERHLEFCRRSGDLDTPAKIRRACIETAGTTLKVKSTRDFPLSGAEEETIKEFREIFRSVAFLPGKESIIFTLTRRHLIDFAASAAYCREKIAAEKRRAGVLDFDDLLEKTDDLLSDKHPEILEAVSKRFRYVLVDEVQDNDPKLIRLVKKLCGNPKESDRLFIVGDAKQSIYLFRKADVAGFMQLQSEFPEEPVALDTSFRSAPVIIDRVNNVFGELFRDRKNIWDPPYDPISANRADAEGSVERILISYNPEKNYQSRLEAEALASWIYETVVRKKRQVYDADGTKRPARFSDVAVLLEKRRHLEYLRPALDRYGIPYDELSGVDFYAKQETADLRNLLSAVLYPEEDIPLYGALRSPYFAVSDAELERAAYDRNGTLFTALKNFAKENPESRTANALESLARWRRYAKSLTPSAALGRMIQESGILAVYAAAFGGARMEGNLIKLQDILRGKADAKPFSLYEFCDLLDTSMEGGLQEKDGDPVDDAGDRVRILTIHASKGLEYPIVCTAFSGDGKRDQTPQVLADEKLGFGVLVKPFEEKSVNILWKLVEDEEKAKAHAEHKRLFYVALTRARDHLLICGSERNKTDGIAPKSFLSYYGEADKALKKAGTALDTEEPYADKLCEPEYGESIESYTAGDAVSVPAAVPEEEIISREKESDAALARGTRLHAVFAGEADDAEFAKQYAEFLKCPLMKDVVFERCEMPVVCGGERKVIDRFVRYADGSYAVIDYKTGSITAAKANGWFAGYESQVKEYVRLMKEVVGADVSGWLYFADEEEEKRIFAV